ncbi:MAG: hypothetical protein MUP17_07770 [candidate division Zixibacteria bacterium]|nr:hypothetical protein [candidate division Zixibacteria bacterium]
MNKNLSFLRKFPKETSGLYIVYELYTFDNLLRLLLKHGLDHEESLDFIIYNCSLSGIVFQERIFNKKYKKLSAKDALPPDLAAHKARLINDLMSLTLRKRKRKLK